jgi:hypothetical protein
MSSDDPADEPRVGASRLAAAAPRASLAGDLMSGAALGLLLGVVVGLANSPVVGALVGGLVSLLAVFLGLESRGDAKLAILAKVQVNGPRIGAFGLAAVAGVALGQFLRINNPLAEAPKAHLARWNDAFPDNPALAAQMMLKERLNITPATLQYGKDVAAVAVFAASGPMPITPGLYGGGSRKALCNDLAPEQFNGNARNALQRYALEGGAYKEAAETLGALPAEQQWPALAGAHAMLCALEAGVANKKETKP